VLVELLSTWNVAFIAHLLIGVTSGSNPGSGPLSGLSQMWHDEHECVYASAASGNQEEISCGMDFTYK